MFEPGQVTETKSTEGPERTPLDSARRWISRGPYRCRLADTPALRHAALDLVLEQYKRQGYIPRDAIQTHVHRYCCVPGAEIFVACARDRVVLATATYVPDGPWGLPMEKLYHDELQALRDAGRRLAEVIGFASRVQERAATVRLVLSLTRTIVWFALRQRVTDLLVVINPKHVRFYAGLLPFKQFGPVKSYDAVQNAPAVPLQLDLTALNRERGERRVAYSKFLGDVDLERLKTTSQLSPLAGPEQWQLA